MDEKIGLTEEFLTEAAEACKINEFDLVGQNRDVVNKTQRFIEEFYKQKRKLDQIDMYVRKKKGELFKFYKTDYEIKISSTSDVMIFIEADEKYQKAMKGLLEQKNVVDFLERTIKNLQNKAYALRNLVELEKRN